MRPPVIENVLARRPREADLIQSNPPPVARPVVTSAAKPTTTAIPSLTQRAAPYFLLPQKAMANRARAAGALIVTAAAHNARPHHGLSETVSAMAAATNPTMIASL